MTDQPLMIRSDGRCGCAGCLTPAAHEWHKCYGPGAGTDITGTRVSALLDAAWEVEQGNGADRLREMAASYGIPIHGDHIFEPGVDVDMASEDRAPSPDWCNVCGDRR